MPFAGKNLTLQRMLYIVPTPVGNMEDITLRALRILREADLVLAEDTRTTGNLLRHYDIQARPSYDCRRGSYESPCSGERELDS